MAYAKVDSLQLKKPRDLNRSIRQPFYASPTTRRELEYIMEVYRDILDRDDVAYSLVVRRAIHGLAERLSLLSEDGKLRSEKTKAYELRELKRLRKP